MSETHWQALHRLAEERRIELGLKREDLQSRGGPSSSWMRAMKHRRGTPSVRHRASLDELDQALGWRAGTAWSVAKDGSPAPAPVPDVDDHIAEALWVPVCETCGRAVSFDDEAQTWRHEGMA